jgi:hypothetical protein
MNVTSIFNYCPSIGTYSFSLTCTGSSDCQALTSFPDVTCITTGTSIICSNGVDCSGAESNYTSISTLTQDPSGALIESNELLLPDYCEKAWFSVNGSDIGLLYTSTYCSSGTAETNTTTLAGNNGGSRTSLGSSSASGSPAGAPTSHYNTSFTSSVGSTGLPTPPRPSSFPSPIIQVSGADRRFGVQELAGTFLWLAAAVLAPSQPLPFVAASPDLYSTTLDRRGIFGSFLPDLIDWLCGETSLSDIINDVFDNLESIACQLAVSSLETELEHAPTLWQACVGKVTTTLNAVVDSGVDPATNSTSVDHLLINNAYVLLLGLV